MLEIVIFEEEFEIQIENKSNIVDVMERLEKINPKTVCSQSFIDCY